MGDRGRDHRVDHIHRFTGRGDPNNPNHEFTYQHQRQMPTETDRYRPGNRPQDDSRVPLRHPKGSKESKAGKRQKTKQQPKPQKWNPVPAHERPILSFNVREKTPDLLPGMITGGEFLSAPDGSGDGVGENICDAAGADDGVEMDMSDDENPELAVTGAAPAMEEAVDAERKPDVISLIRSFKTRTSAGKPKNPVEDNDDFISLSFGDEPIHLSQDDEDSNHKRRKVNGKENRDEPSFSHRYNHFGPPRDTGPPGLPPRPLTYRKPTPPPQLYNSDLQTRNRSVQQSNSGGRSSLPNASHSKHISFNTSGNPAMRNKGHDRRLDIPTNRKRNYSEMSRGKTTIDGNITHEYMATPRSDPCPWTKMGSDHSRSLSMSNWLHNEILDFIAYIQPRAYEHAVRRELVHRIRAVVTNLWPDTDLRVFGSFAAELYLPTSDIDLVVISTSFAKMGIPRYSEKNALYKLRQALLSSNTTKTGSLAVIANAKVPIIKFVDRETNIHVDISFENSSGLVANETFIKWKTRYPAMPILLTVIKQFLAMRGLNEVYLGGLGSFSVTCLIVSMLQMHPGAASGGMDPRRHLGVMLLEFLELYGKNFNTETLGICVDSRKPSYFRKNDVFPVIQRGATPPQTDLLCIQDPNNAENDISRSSYHIKMILTLWAEALDDLVGQMKKFETLQFVDRQNRSLLGVILGGNYGKIEEQRWLMKKVYMDRIGPLGDILMEERQWGETAPFVTQTSNTAQQAIDPSSANGPAPNRKPFRGNNFGGPPYPRKSKQRFHGKGQQDEPIVID
ncbi:hypothetical protein C7212DRAFT_360768 [Tuber magnatum]|uniref:polynucleotide adenylyltransferase n=1 Tax=Tuber magnatum TaxID=42249 RepID=A0A317SZK4_9PEZI|nr:hypothetical protein C7212DRAFT_360768 [Tuber magnatum]